MEHASQGMESSASIMLTYGMIRIPMHSDWPTISTSFKSAYGNELLLKSCLHVLMEKCTIFIQTKLPTLLEDMPLDLRNIMWVMHDCSPVCYILMVRECWVKSLDFSGLRVEDQHTGQLNHNLPIYSQIFPAYFQTSWCVCLQDSLLYKCQLYNTESFLKEWIAWLSYCQPISCNLASHILEKEV
jgi:hypothetical protein